MKEKVNMGDRIMNPSQAGESLKFLVGYNG